MLAVGAGRNETEFRAHRLPFDARVDRFAEAFHIIRRLVAGETVTHHGRYFDIEGCVMLPPSRRDHPIPLMVGSTGRRMLAITLPYVSGWNAWFTEFDNRPESVPALLERLRGACAAAGRDPLDIEKSVALLLDFGSATKRNHSTNPITGSDDEMADALWRVFDAGIDHVQLVLDPITEATIERAAHVAATVRG